MINDQPPYENPYNLYEHTDQWARTYYPDDTKASLIRNEMETDVRRTIDSRSECIFCTARNRGYFSWPPCNHTGAK